MNEGEGEKNNKSPFVDLFSWFGNQREGLRLEQGMMGVQGGLMEGGRRGEHGGVQ